MVSASHCIGHAQLLARVTEIFAAYVPPEHAAFIAHCLVEAEARGVASHGIGRIPVYTRRLRLGLVNAEPNLRVSGDEGATAHVDGDNGMGYVVAHRAMQVAIERATRHGVSLVLASNSNHFGMSACYLQMAIDQGLGAMVLTNAPPLMPVWGGRSPFLGTSPFALGMPGGATPLKLDMATSVVAFGKLRRAARLGEPIPEGWALDSEGRSTTDAEQAIKGVVLPMAGPKGSGMALLMEALAGVMSGAAFGGEVRNQNSDFSAPQNVGHTFLVFRTDLFQPAADYASKMDELVGRAKASPLAEGFDEVLMPGEREDRLCQQALRDGLVIGSADLRMLDEERELASAHA